MRSEDHEIAASSRAEPTAFTGRAAQLSMLKTAVENARAGQFSAVVVSGEPGIGKTRITDEMSEYARRLGFEIAIGRCFENQTEINYFPFVQACRRLADYGSAP